MNFSYDERKLILESILYHSRRKFGAEKTDVLKYDVDVFVIGTTQIKNELKLSDK